MTPLVSRHNVFAKREIFFVVDAPAGIAGKSLNTAASRRELRPLRTASAVAVRPLRPDLPFGRFGPGFARPNVDSAALRPPCARRWREFGDCPRTAATDRSPASRH